MIIKIDPLNPNMELIVKSAEIVKSGGIVIFPTETLYGLGGLASSEKVLQKIYDIKKRSLNKPLPVMVPHISCVSPLVEEFPERAKKLAKNYWPGPLTLVMKSAESLSNLITMGKGKVGIRIPDHNIALELLKCTGEPLAVTSANISGEDNLLSIEEIITVFEDMADIIIDAGPLKYGSPSTVVDMSENPPVILRHGKISTEEILEA